MIKNKIKKLFSALALTSFCITPILSSVNFNVETFNSSIETKKYGLNYNGKQYSSLDNATLSEISKLLSREKIIGEPKFNSGSKALNIEDARIYDTNKIKKAYKLVSGQLTPDFDYAKKSYTSAIKETKYYDYIGNLHDNYQSAMQSILNSTIVSGMGTINLNDELEFNPLNPNDKKVFLEYVLNSLESLPVGSSNKGFSYDYFYKSNNYDYVTYKKNEMNSSITDTIKKHFIEILNMLPILSIDIKSKKDYNEHNTYEMRLAKDYYNNRFSKSSDEFNGYNNFDNDSGYSIFDSQNQSNKEFSFFGRSKTVLTESTRRNMYNLASDYTRLHKDANQSYIITTNGISLEMLRTKNLPFSALSSLNSKKDFLNKKMFDFNSYIKEKGVFNYYVAEEATLNYFGHKLSLEYVGDCNGFGDDYHIGIFENGGGLVLAGHWKKTLHLDHTLYLDPSFYKNSNFQEIKNNIINDYFNLIKNGNEATKIFDVLNIDQKEYKDFLYDVVDLFLSNFAVPNPNEKGDHIKSFNTEDNKVFDSYLNTFYDSNEHDKMDEKFWKFDNYDYENNIFKLNSFLRDENGIWNLVNKLLEKNGINNSGNTNSLDYKLDIFNNPNISLVIMYNQMPIFELDSKKLLSLIDEYNLKNTNNRINKDKLINDLSSRKYFPKIIDNSINNQFMLLDSFINISNYDFRNIILDNINNSKLIKFEKPYEPKFKVEENKVIVNSNNKPLIKGNPNDPTVYFDLESILYSYNLEYDLKKINSENTLKNSEDILVLRDSINSIKQFIYKEYLSTQNSMNMSYTEVVTYDNYFDLNSAIKNQKTLEPLPIIYLRDLNGNVINKDIFNVNGTINIKNYNIYNPSDLTLSNIAYTYAIKGSNEFVFYDNELDPIRSDIYNLYKLVIKNIDYYFYTYDDAYNFLSDYIKVNSDYILV